MNPSSRFLDVLPDVTYVREEVHHQDGYFWDNRNRSGEAGWVVQQTLKGVALFETPEQRRIVNVGSCMLFSYGEDSWYGLADNREYRLRWVLIQGGLMEWARALRDEFGAVMTMDLRGEAAGILAGLSEDAAHGVWRDRLYLAEAASRLLTALYREQTAGHRGEDPVAYGRHLLETQFRSPRNLKEWCGELGISREHFSREFSARYGETPAAYLRRLRLEHAHGLLRNHHLPLSDVASASGFVSEQTFHRAYRRHFGVPPGQGRIQDLPAES